MVAGAVYKPDVLIEPIPTGIVDHVTALLTVFVTIAVSCAVWPPFSVVVAGLTLTATGGTVPFKVMACVDGSALSLIVIAAVKEPAITGVKVAVIMQLFPAVRLVGQLLDSLKLLASIPDRVIA